MLYVSKLRAYCMANNHVLDKKKKLSKNKNPLLILYNGKYGGATLGPIKAYICETFFCKYNIFIIY